MVLICYFCNFNTKDKIEFEKHIKTQEHLNNLENKKHNIDDKTCSKCYKEFSTKGNKNVHEKKCTGALNYNQCEYCNKVFTTTAGKSHHRKICKNKPINTTININGNNNNITIDNSTNINITVERNSFTKEDLSYMTKEEKYKFIEECIKDNYEGLLNYINEVYLNKTHIENNTIRKTCKDFIEYYNGRKWCIEPDDLFFNSFMEEIQDKFDLYLFEGNFKNLEIIDVRNFMYKVGVYLDWIELTYKNKSFSKDNIIIEKKQKEHIKMLYTKKIIENIANTNN